MVFMVISYYREVKKECYIVFITLFGDAEWYIPVHGILSFKVCLN